MSQNSGKICSAALQQDKCDWEKMLTFYLMMLSEQCLIAVSLLSVSAKIGSIVLATDCRSRAVRRAGQQVKAPERLVK